MANRYLSEANIRQQLQGGGAVEQWLKTRIDGDDRVIEWLRIHKERHGGYGVTLFDVYDEGTDEFSDIYEFSSYEPDEPYGLLKSCPDWKPALKYAISDLGAQPEKFVNSGVIQDEYADFIKQEGIWPACES